MVEEESQLSSEPHLPFLGNSDVRDLKISTSLARGAGAQCEDALGLHSRPFPEGCSEDFSWSRVARCRLHIRCPSRTFHGFLYALGDMGILCLSLYVLGSQLDLRSSGLDPKTPPCLLSAEFQTWADPPPDTKQVRPTLEQTLCFFCLLQKQPVKK